MGISNFDLGNTDGFSSNSESFLGDTGETYPGVYGSLMNPDGSVAPSSSGTSSSPSSPSSSSGILSSILGALSGGSGSTLTALENAGILGSDILGTIGNIGLSNSEGQLMNEGLGLANEYSNLTPQQVSSMINRYMTGLSGAPGTSLSFPQALNYFEQPLSNNLTQGVENQVQQSLAEQGLAQSPGIMNSVTTQALAPYMLQEQNAAESLYQNLLNQSSSDLFQQLGLPLSAIGSVRFPPSSPISPLINPVSSGLAGAGIGTLNSALGNSGGGGSLLSSADNALSSPIGSALAGGLTGGLLGATTPGLGGAIQPGAAGALEGAGLGAGISALSTPVATGLASDIMGSVGGGLLSGLGTGIGTVLDTVLGAVVPFIGPLLAAIPFLFQGANPNQVKPAQAQQPFEVAADDIYNAVKGGYLTPEQGDQAIQAISSSANTQLSSLVNSIMSSGGGNQKIANTIQEVSNVLANEESSVNALPAENAQPYNASAINALLMNPSTSGYYPGSVSGGNQIAQSLIQQLLQGTSNG